MVEAVRFDNEFAGLLDRQREIEGVDVPSIVMIHVDTISKNIRHLLSSVIRTLCMVTVKDIIICRDAKSDIKDKGDVIDVLSLRSNGVNTAHFTHLGVPPARMELVNMTVMNWNFATANILFPLAPASVLIPNKDFYQQKNNELLMDPASVVHIFLSENSSLDNFDKALPDSLFSGHLVYYIDMHSLVMMKTTELRQMHSELVQAGVINGDFRKKTYFNVNKLTLEDTSIPEDITDEVNARSNSSMDIMLAEQLAGILLGNIIVKPSMYGDNIALSTVEYMDSFIAQIFNETDIEATLQSRAEKRKVTRRPKIVEGAVEAIPVEDVADTDVVQPEAEVSISIEDVQGVRYEPVTNDMVGDIATAVASFNATTTTTGTTPMLRIDSIANTGFVQVTTTTTNNTY